MSKPQHNPFITGQWGGHPYGAVSAADRISMTKSFGLAEVDAALRLPGMQRTVVAALERRRRYLIQEQTP